MKLVCFDFDGTLADSFDFVLESYTYIFRKYANTSMDFELFNTLSGPVEEGILMKYFKEKYDPRMFKEYMEYYTKESPNRIVLFPHVKEMLLKLKAEGVHMVYASGRQDITSIFTLKQLGIYDLFEGHYFGGMEDKSIKDQILMHVSKDFNVDVKDMVYIGDVPQDFKDCQKVGCECINVLFTHPSCWDEILSLNPNNTARTVEELDKLIHKFLQK